MFYANKKTKEIYKLVSTGQVSLTLINSKGKTISLPKKDVVRLKSKSKFLRNKVSVRSEKAYIRAMKGFIDKDLGRLTNKLIKANNGLEVLNEYKFDNPLEIATNGIEGVSNAHTFNFKKSINKVYGISVSSVLNSDDKIKIFVENKIFENVKLISSVQDKYRKEVEELLRTDGLDQKKVIATLKKRFNVSHSRAKLIARNESLNVLSGLEEVQQTNVGIKQYKWVTAHDERVRESHVERDGKTFNWGSSDIKPGEEINCRCIAEGIIRRNK